MTESKTDHFFASCKAAAELVDRYLSDESPGIAKEQVRESMRVVERALEAFSLDHIAMSFNGGKDCLVMLVVFLATVYKTCQGKLSAHPHLESIYVKYDKSFQMVDDFVADCCDRYALNSVTLHAPMKEAFEKYLEQHSETQAILVGIRRTDPYGESLDFIQKTDHGWPDFTRIHPVLEWHYVQVWDFLRVLDIPYCKLYDMGYTSLGDTNNTIENPKLRRTSVDGISYHLPAYELMSDTEERLGRNVSSDRESKSQT